VTALVVVEYLLPPTHRGAADHEAVAGRRCLCFGFSRIKNGDAASGLHQEEIWLEHGYKTQAYWRQGKTEVERVDRMTELTLAKIQDDPNSIMESFENIGMEIVDEDLLKDPIYTAAE